MLYLLSFKNTLSEMSDNGRSIMNGKEITQGLSTFLSFA